MVMNIIERLLDVGFSEYEASVYAALIPGKKLSATEIGTISGVPRGRVYSILSSLMDKGMCFMIPGNVKRFQALPPNDAFAQLYNKKKSEYEVEKAKAFNLSNDLESIYKKEGNLKNEFDSVAIYTSMASTIKKFENT